jgi:hypothetical protein
VHRRHKATDVPPSDGLLGGPAIETFRAFAPESDDVIKVAYEDGVLCMVEQFCLIADLLAACLRSVMSCIVPTIRTR